MSILTRRFNAPIDETAKHAALQDEQRDRRRQHLLVTYDGTFDLTAEIAAICDPLARRVAGEPHPLSQLHHVEDLIAAVHGAIRTIWKLLVERDARARTAHVPFANRGQAVRAIVALAQPPAEPEIADAAMLSGAWASVLTTYASEYAEPLSAYLTVARRPGDIDPAVSISGRVEAVLRDIDSAAGDLDRSLNRAVHYRTECEPKPVEQADVQQHRAVLAEFGVEL